MGLTDKEYKKIREELETCAKPLYFFHDDPDGICSFLQVYAYTREGYGVIVKARPIIDTKFLQKVNTYNPDKIFVLDIAMMEQEFVDEAKRPIIWVDHHPTQGIENVKYFNPRITSETNECVAYLTYKSVKQSLWVCMVGCISDMYWPEDLVSDFRKKYLDLLPENINSAREALYETELGKLCRIFSAVLKGTSSDAMKYVKALTRIKTPYEILNQENTRARFIYKKFKEIDKDYQELLTEAKKIVAEDNIILFIYPDNKIAFSSDLSNQMIYNNPDKTVIIARRKNGELKLSFRSNKVVIPPLLDKALVGCEGYGGGHEFAAGACIREEDFKQFFEVFKELHKEAYK